VSEQPDNLILVFLRRIDEKLDATRADMVEVKERLGLLEAGYASLSRRVDRLGGDVTQIKRRLDIVDAPAE
jgi:predicted nuclease with TOPRIM domain